MCLCCIQWKWSTFSTCGGPAGIMMSLPPPALWEPSTPTSNMFSLPALLSLPLRLLSLPLLPSRRMLINSTRASCPSSPPWHLSTPPPRLAASSEAPATQGTPRTLAGLNSLTRKSCSRAGKERQTTAPSPHSSDSPMAPASQSRDAPTAGRGQRPQSNLFPSGVFLFLYHDIRYQWHQFGVIIRRHATETHLFMLLSWDYVANSTPVIHLWGITIKVTFTTVPKSAAKHGTKYYGKLWKGPRVADATRKGLSVLMPPRTSSTVLCRTENTCTCPLHLPAFDSWQLKCTLYTFFLKTILCSVCSAAAVDDDENSSTAWASLCSLLLVPAIPHFLTSLSLSVCSASFQD